ncbi:MAG: 4,4-dithiodibutanoate disulfide reductase [Actinomycetota bacterium]|nr:4,4-dithiodibutanoate disulfide reductase [Actinomycetota bacterium]
MPAAFTPARLGPLTLRNRIIKAATFEGRTRRGEVTQELVDFHTEVARGGAAMSTVAYCAVAPDGRVFRDCLVLDEQSVPGLRRLTDAVHAEGAAASAQLGHAGLVADAVSNKMRSLAPSRRFSAPGRSLVPAATAQDLARVRGDFVRAARCAVEAGFDAVEVHVGHNYLLSSFLSPNLNKRKDEYGGSLANRARFPREVLTAVRDAVGDRAAVTAKLNMADGVRRGLWLTESLEIARLIERDGSVDALQLTGGSSLLNGMYFFRGDVPIDDFARTQPALLRPLVRPFLRRIMPTYPFEEAFFLPFARQFRAALDLPLILLGGINGLDTIESAIEEGFAFVAMARALLREPDLPRKLAAQSSAESLCIHCNKCAPTIYSRTGTHCVLVPQPSL